MRVLLRTYGWRGLIRRASHELRIRLNRFQSTPDEQALTVAAGNASAYCPVNNWQSCDAIYRERSMQRAAQVKSGRYQAFGDAWCAFPDTAKGWRVNSRTAYEYPLAPWWKFPLMPAGHDIKDVWEPARFAWVYDLVRAYQNSKDAQLVQSYEHQLQAWHAASPAFMGPHWACGQETAIRALALLHAEASLPLRCRENESNTLTTRLLFYSGQRINDAIAYGLSQRNNHGISEAAGLIHLGYYFKGRASVATHWLQRGLRLINEQIRDQFAPDGWYAQHSFNYMRVALEQAIYVQRLLLSHGATLAPDAVARLKAAIALINQVVICSNGRVPNHGANDGARVLPLSGADYQDFRPLLTLSACVLKTPIPDGMTPDEDVLQWLGFDASDITRKQRASVLQGESGWLSVRYQKNAIFVFAGTYQHRPSHLDTLHLHLNVGDLQVVTDAGTYRYNAPAPWNNTLSSGFVHNAPLINGAEPAERGPRFLWLSWPSAKIHDVSEDSKAVHATLVRSDGVTREFSLSATSLNVTDRVSTKSETGNLQVTWLLHPDVINRYTVEADSSITIDAREGDVTAWYSHTYSNKRPSRAVRIVRPLQGDATQIRSVIRFTDSHSN